jgi:hypothetical protein
MKDMYCISCRSSFSVGLSYGKPKYLVMLCYFVTKQLHKEKNSFSASRNMNENDTSLVKIELRTVSEQLSSAKTDVEMIKRCFFENAGNRQ